MTTIELKNNIIFELLFSNKMKIEEEIDYKRFKDLYAGYEFLSEAYFASILGIRLKVFSNLKSGFRNATVLRNFDCSILKNTVLDKLYRKNLVKNNSRITYSQFLDILKHFPFLNEYSLAEILEIKLPRFKNFKNSKNPNETAEILKRFNITLEEEKIAQRLISDKIVYPGLEINYEIFKKLHSLYPHIRESRFAYILEIKSAAFNRLKKGQSKSIILKSRISSFIEEQKNDIINKLIRERGAKLKEEISYERFLELYSGFEYISKCNFAVNVLGISYETYKSFKYKGKAVILKNRFSLSDQDRITFFNEIIKRFNLKEGSFIYYETFTMICNYYKDYLTEYELCNILGIEETSYYNINITIVKLEFLMVFLKKKLNL